MITGLGAHHPRIERARSLRTKNGRRDERRFLFEGPTLLAEALRSSMSIEEVFATQAAIESNAPIIAELEKHGTHIFRVNERTGKRLSEVQSPTGLIAVAAISEVPLSKLFAEPGCVLALNVNDPGNAGSLIRSAEAFGARGVVFTSGSVEPFSPKIVRSAMGSLFRVPITAAPAPQIRDAAQGWRITGLAAGGSDIRELGWSDREVIVVGQERRGLGAWEQLCDRLAAVPMSPGAESLNAAIAGAIGLYEAARGPKSSAVKRV